MHRKQSNITVKKSTETATKIINWAALSEYLAQNSDSIRSNRCPKKYKAKTDKLLQLVEWWVEEKELLSPEKLKSRIEDLDLYSILTGQN